MDKLAVDGGEQAIKQFVGEEIKIGLEELREVIGLWVDDEQCLDKIEACIAATSWHTPWLFRYYHPEQSKVEELEAACRDYFAVPYALARRSVTAG